MTEQWRTVVGFDRYEVSDCGQIRTWMNTRNAPIQTPIYLSGWRKDGIEDGYRLVMLRRAGRSHKCYVHRLVLEAFIGPAPAGFIACHFPDRTPSNCRLDNLRWGSKRSNEHDKILQGSPRGRPRNASCNHGHPMDANNSRLAVDGRGNTYWACITCARERMRRWRAR